MNWTNKSQLENFLYFLLFPSVHRDTVSVVSENLWALPVATADHRSREWV